jgi:hypothetical protein
VTLLRGVEVLAGRDVLEREVFGVLFLAWLEVLVVLLDFLLVPDDFLVLLAVVLRAIAVLLTFRWSSNYSMRALVAVKA